MTTSPGAGRQMFAVINHLVHKRKTLAMTQEDLAARIGRGIDRATLARWERAQAYPGRERLFYWAHALSVEIIARDSATPSMESE